MDRNDPIFTSHFPRRSIQIRFSCFAKVSCSVILLIASWLLLSIFQLKAPIRGGRPDPKHSLILAPCHPIDAVFDPPSSSGLTIIGHPTECPTSVLTTNVTLLARVSRLNNTKYTKEGVLRRCADRSLNKEQLAPSPDTMPARTIL